MKLNPENANSTKALFTIIFFIIYVNFLFGYYLSNMFCSFFGDISKSNLSEIVEFKKELSLYNLAKFILDYFTNWAERVSKKFFLFIRSLREIIRVFKISKRKFKHISRFKLNLKWLKRNLKRFKRNLKLLKRLLLKFWQAFEVLKSLTNEIFFFANIIDFISKFYRFVLFLTLEHEFILKSVYVLYSIILALYFFLLGFLFGLFYQNKEIYIYILLRLIQKIYNEGLEHVFFDHEGIQGFCKFSLKINEEISMIPLKLILQKPSIPLPIWADPFIEIEIDFVLEQFKDYQFQLFTFYHDVNKKIKH